MKNWSKGMIILSLFLLAAGCTQKASDSSYLYRDGSAKLAGRTVQLELARDESKKERGLSGQAKLNDDQGMLFVYDKPSQPYFWMKDMLFGIDIVWIRSGKVVDITKDAPATPGVAEKDLRLYQPKAEIDEVLELSAGWANRYGLKAGDSVDVVSKE